MHTSLQLRGTALGAFALIAAAAILVSPIAAQPNVAINELMYHPLSGDEAEEFLELHNAGDADADLSGWRFSSGLTFTFPQGTTIPAGGFLVLSPNAATFAQVYAGVAPPDIVLAGPYAGALSNGGERIALRDAADAFVDDFEYDDRLPWPTFPDGSGSSLELVDPALDNALPASWQASAANLGTPGLPNSAGGREPPFVDLFPWPPVVYDFHVQFVDEDWWEQMEANAGTNVMVEATLTFEGYVYEGIGVRIKGASSDVPAFTGPKRPFKMDFNQFRPDNQRFMGLNELKFSNGWYDPLFMREPLSSLAAAEVGLPTPRYGFCNLWFNGQLWGVYNIQEQVDDYMMLRVYGDDTGDLYKAEIAGDPPNLASLEHLGAAIDPYLPIYVRETNDEPPLDYGRLIALCDALDNSTDEQFLTQAGALLHVDSAIGYLALVNATGHLDSYYVGHNYYLYDNPDTGLFHVVPWDSNTAWGTSAFNFPAEDTVFIDPFLSVVVAPVIPFPLSSRRPLARLYDEAAGDRAAYVDWMRRLLEGPFNETWVRARAAEARPVIEAHVAADPQLIHGFEAFERNWEEDLDLQIPGGPPLRGLFPYTRDRHAFLMRTLGLATPETTGLVAR